MVKSVAVVLAMAGAATAYNNAPRHVLSTPVYPTSPFTPIPPVTTPVYSSTATARTTYYPSQTDDYGAISTHKITSTRHFDPSTYNPGPSDACHGGVINFLVADDITQAPTEVTKIGMAIAKAAVIAGVDYHDFTVYEAHYDATLTGTWITTLFCKKDVFDKIVKSMYASPTLWSLGLGGNYHHIVYPDAASQNLYVNCNTASTPSTFLYNGQCVACTPLPAANKCAAGKIAKCTTFSNTYCAAP